MFRYSAIVRRCEKLLRSLSSYTAEQRQIQELAQDFAKNEFLPNARQWERDGQFSVTTLQKAAELGFSGICVRNDVGGCGLGAMDAAIVFEALAYGDVSTTAFLTVQNMVATVIDRFGTEKQRMKYLPEMMTLQKFGSYCLTEPGSGSDAASLSTSAKTSKEDDAQHFVLEGSKAFISGAGLSDIYLVMARTGADRASGISAFLVEKGTEGLVFGKEEEKMGWISQPTASVFFHNVIVQKDSLVGKEGEGFHIAMQALDRGRVNIAACAVGGAQFCLESAQHYTDTRYQFKQPIAAFQNTQFTLAQMATQITAARLMVYHAAQSIDNKESHSTVNAAMAKVFATEMAVDVSNQCLQLFGGYGYLKDYHVERYVRDLRVMTILEGTNEVMKMVIHKGMQSSRQDTSS